MPITIAILSDLHYADTMPNANRLGHLADVLLLRAVKRLDRYIKPDLVLLLGDCIDQADGDSAIEQLTTLRDIMAQLSCPWFAIPGNHDPRPDVFYRVFDQPDETVDVAGIRLLPFLDPEAPGYNATRTDTDLARMRAARRDGFSGTVVAAQHVSLYPAHLQKRLAYSYTNLDAVMDAATSGGIDLCVGGHSHTNTGIVQHGPTSFLSVDALCESPFGYTLVTIDDTATNGSPAPRITSRNEYLAMPESLGLVDYHSHTQFAYCSENMHADRSPDLAFVMGLRGQSLTEHSGQLYFTRDHYWSGRFGEGVSHAKPEDSRIADYFDATDPLRTHNVLVGLEVDADFDGNLVLRDEDRHRLDVIVGAVHVLREGQKPEPQLDAFTAEFVAVTERLCEQGIQVLAHPFRVFRRKGLTPPTWLYEWLVGVLKRTGVASELNFHTNEPHAAFVQMCIESGVPLSLGSDAHNLYEVGEFYPHLALLRSTGVRDDLSRVLWSGPASTTRSSPVTSG